MKLNSPRQKAFERYMFTGSKSVHHKDSSQENLFKSIDTTKIFSLNFKKNMLHSPKDQRFVLGDIKKFDVTYIKEHFGANPKLKSCMNNIINKFKIVKRRRMSTMDKAS